MLAETTEILPVNCTISDCELQEYRVYLIAHFCIVSVYLVISTVYLVVFTAYIVTISFTHCYIHIFSSSAASVFNKFSSVQLLAFTVMSAGHLAGQYQRYGSESYSGIGYVISVHGM